MRIVSTYTKRKERVNIYREPENRFLFNLVENLGDVNCVNMHKRLMQHLVRTSVDWLKMLKIGVRNEIYLYLKKVRN